MSDVLHIFDLDGTLLDNKQQILQAYRAAAIELRLPVPTANTIWGRTAAEWKCTPELHKRKTEIYAQLVNTVTLAWAALVYTRIGVQCRRVWTGASRATVDLYCANPLLCRYAFTARTAMSLKEKRNSLLDLRQLFPNLYVHYYDDDVNAAETITRNVRNIEIHTDLKGVEQL
jgi:hypothetical protein